MPSSARRAARSRKYSSASEAVGSFAVPEDRIVGAVTESYLDEQSALAAERQEQRRSRARALLEGRTPMEVPGLVMYVGFGNGPATTVATRRRLRRVQGVLDRAFATDALALLDAHGGHVLAPGHVQLPDQLRELLCEATGDPDPRLAAVVITAATTTRDLPAAARLAEEVVRIAATCGREPAVHRLDDVLLEYHLARPSAAGPRIAALLAPLDGRPELERTLRTHLAQRQDRRGAGPGAPGDGSQGPG
ncbi:hypothetical protein ABZ848_07405 [Streptomyces sp. NPDC047081]|uniref:hypothetical protein n=1 Tax=Streptomyces sp. NPDC047081 TaxID=3154706 RepID=UPI0033C9A574